MKNFFALCVLCVFASSVHGLPLHMITESDPGGLGNSILRTYDTFADLDTGNQSSANIMGTNPFGSGVSIGGLTFDGSRYLMITESDPGGIGNLFIRSYDTLNDLRTLNQSSVDSLGISQNPFGSGVSVGGITFDGSQYHMITESDPGGIGNLFLRSYDSYADLIALNQSTVRSIGTGQNIFGSAVSVGGLTYDGSSYYMVTESDPGGIGNLFVRRYDSLLDLDLANQSSIFGIANGQNPFGSAVSVGGLLAMPDPGPMPISEPSTITLSLTGLAIVGLLRLRKRRVISSCV